MGKSRKKKSLAVQRSQTNEDVADNASGQQKTVDAKKQEQPEQRSVDPEKMPAKLRTQRDLFADATAEFDKMFKFVGTTLNSAKYMFVGPGQCCVDPDIRTNCDHRICRRPKSEGITCPEWMVIKHSHVEILMADSERKKNALRNARDRNFDKMTEVMGKFAAHIFASLPGVTGLSTTVSEGVIRDMLNLGQTDSASKERDMIERDIRKQLDQFRRDINMAKTLANETESRNTWVTGNSQATENKGRSDASRFYHRLYMSKQETKATSDTFKSHLKQRLLRTKKNSFSQALSIVDQFLAITKPDDLGDAILQFKDVLQLSGEMDKDLESPFTSLRDFYDTLAALSPTDLHKRVEHKCLTDLLTTLKANFGESGELPAQTNVDLSKAFRRCLDLEAEAKIRLEKELLSLPRQLLDSSNLRVALNKLEDEFVARSPIPQLTRVQLGHDIAQVMDMADVKILLDKAASGLDLKQLEAHITSLVIARTKKISSQSIEELEGLAKQCQYTAKHPRHDLFKAAITNVLTKMTQFVANQENKTIIQPVAIDKGESQSSSTIAFTGMEGGDISLQLEKRASINTATTAPTGTHPSQDSLANATQSKIREEVVSRGNDGLLSAFESYRHGKSFLLDDVMQSKAKCYQDLTDRCIKNPTMIITITTTHLYEKGLCPALAALLICTSIANLTTPTKNEDHMYYMKKLSSGMNALPPSISAEWRHVFQHVIIAILQLYTAIYVETLATFPTLPATYTAIRTAKLMTASVLLTRDSNTAKSNLKTFEEFLRLCFSGDSENSCILIQDCLLHYRYFCENEQFRCLNSDSCSKHMDLNSLPYDPAPTNIDSEEPFFVTQAVVDKGVSSRAERNRAYDKYSVRYSQNSKRRGSGKKTVVDRSIPKGVSSSQLASQKAVDILSTRIHALAAKDELSEHAATPCELFKALGDALSDSHQEHYHTYHSPAAADILTSRKAFRQSDASQNPANLAIGNVFKLHNLFKRIENRSLSDEEMTALMSTVKEEAMSGKHPSPADFIDKYLATAGKIATVPKRFEDAMNSTREDMEHLLQVHDARVAFETTRLKHLLSIFGAAEPSCQSFQEMLSKSVNAFKEYYNIVRGDVMRTKGGQIVKIEQSWCKVIALFHAKELLQNSPALVEYVQCALEDWKSRPDDITEYSCNHQNTEFKDDRSQDSSGIGPDVTNEREAQDDDDDYIVSQHSEESVDNGQLHIDVKGKADSDGELQQCNVKRKGKGKAVRIPQTDTDDEQHKRDVKGKGKAVRIPPTDSSDDDLLAMYNNLKVVLDEDQSEDVKPVADFSDISDNSDNDHDEDRDEDEDTPSSPTPDPAARVANLQRLIDRLEADTVEMRKNAQVIDSFNIEHGKVLHGIAKALETRVEISKDMLKTVKDFWHLDE